MPDDVLLEREEYRISTQTTNPNDRERELTLNETSRFLLWVMTHAKNWEGHRLYAYSAMMLFAGLRRTDLISFKCRSCSIGRRSVDHSYTRP